MKLTIGKITKEYNMKDERESQLMFNNLFLYYINKFPFFINVLITMADIADVQEDQKNQLAYTYYDHEYERIKIHINYEKIEKLNMKEDMIMFLIFHEYLHNYYYHFIRLKKEFEECSDLANTVADYYVNELLYELFGDVKRQDFFNKGLGIVDQKAMEEICQGYNIKFPYTFDDKPLEPVMYKKLKELLPPSAFKQSPKSKKGQGKGEKGDKNNSNGNNNDNNDNGDNYDNIDSHNVGIEKEKESMNNVNKKRKAEGKPQMSENDMQSLAQNRMDNVEKEIQTNQGVGRGDEVILREKAKMMKKNPFLNTLKLKNVINNKLKCNIIKTYKRISRKRDNSEIVFKGKLKQEGRKVVVALDVSGSISDKDLKMFYEMLNGFLEDKKHKTSLDVIYWSSCEIKPEVNFHQNIKDVKDLMKLKINSSGGTEIEYLHEFIKEYYGKTKEKIVLINITDGFFYINDTIPKECLQYYFILTEPSEEKSIIEGYKDTRVKTQVIKEYR